MSGKRIFYSIYFGCILLFVIGMVPVHIKLYHWLAAYEASQPAVKCEEIYEEFFANPDWRELYDLSGTQDTLFEGRDAYADYMAEKVGDNRLTYSETSSGLSGDKKYYLQLDNEKLLSFTLVNNGQSEKGIVSWELGDIVLLFSRTKSVRVQKAEGHTVYINGVEVSDAYTIQRSWTLAEDYLPEGIHGSRMVVQQVRGLLRIPEITVKNEEGVLMDVRYDADSDIYLETGEECQPEISAEERKAVLSFAENYCKYMINAYNNLSALFEKDSEIYKAVKNSDRWVMQEYADFYFKDEDVTDYIQYSSDVFYARVKMTMNVTRPSGTIKAYPLDSAFFFRKQEDGGILAFKTTNNDIRQVRTEVLLTWRDQDTILKTEYVAADSKYLNPPSVTAPDGFVFSGWMKEEFDKDGKQCLTLLFSPEIGHRIALPEGYVLEPMVICPLFEQP